MKPIQLGPLTLGFCWVFSISARSSKHLIETAYLRHLDLQDAKQDHHKLSRAVAAFAMADRRSCGTVFAYDARHIWSCTP
jgi:hypothetical protein